jgi:hypothetical protein
VASARDDNELFDLRGRLDEISREKTRSNGRELLPRISREIDCETHLPTRALSRLGRIRSFAIGELSELSQWLWILQSFLADGF